MSKKINLKALSMDELSAFMEAQGLPKYRTKQLLTWIYLRYAASLDEITEFSKDLRSRLAEISSIGNLGVITRQRSSDGTEKFLFSLEDGQTIVASPHKVYGPETNDLILQLRKRGITRVILCGMSANPELAAR